MKKMYAMILVLIMISFLITSCSDTKTNPESKRMRTYAMLANAFNSDDNQIYSTGYISVYYYPAVSQTNFELDSLNIYEDDFNGFTKRSWLYHELTQDPIYHWLADKSYELKITSNNNDYTSKSNCEVPEAFVINANSLPEEINPLNDFVLNWSNCENATNFRLYYSINKEDSAVDSLIILDSNTNSFTFTSDMLNIPGAEFIFLQLTAINGPVITSNSEGNFSGDGDGYFFGEYDPGCKEISYEYSKNSISNKMDRINKENELKEKAENLFKSYLGF